MKAVLTTLALVALVALVAFTLMSTRRARASVGPMGASAVQSASPATGTGQPVLPGAPIPVVDPAQPGLAATSPDVGVRAGVPVLDAVGDPSPASPVAESPSIVAEALAVVADSPTVVAEAPAIAAESQATGGGSLAAAAQAPLEASTSRALGESPSPAQDPRNQPLESLGAAPAPSIDPRPFAEAHWQGLEAIPKTPTVAKMLKVPPNVEGVILDDVTLPADLQGFQAGDVVTAVNGVPTPDLVSFIRATDRIREAKRTTIDFVRAGVSRRMDITALADRLGIANGETPPMIPPGAQRPHIYMGPCVNCHRIGTTGNLAIDQGDNPRNRPGPVRADGPVPHRDRGPCATCHQIIQ